MQKAVKKVARRPNPARRQDMRLKQIFRWTGYGVGGLFLFYLVSIVWFEARLGMSQPRNSNSLILATFNSDSEERRERVLRLEEIDGEKYIAVNHWPRFWYLRALSNPSVEIALPGQDLFMPYTAVQIEGKELDKVKENYTFDLEFRFRTGFPPRRFLRLDPRKS